MKSIRVLWGSLKLGKARIDIIPVINIIIKLSLAN